MRSLVDKKIASVLDLGCGNGQLLEFFKEKKWTCNYFGIDFSQPLINVARRQNAEATFICGDVNNLGSIVTSKFNFVIYSHVLEILESPERSLIEAKKLTDTILIRFFEPPEFNIDTVELREQDLGQGSFPYIRRMMSKKYYQLILTNIGCKGVDVYKDSTKDQVHVLHF